MNDLTKRPQKRMRKSEHGYSCLRKTMKGIRRVSFAILIMWSVSLMAESNSLTELTRADVDGVVATLQGNDGDFIANVIEGQDKFGTGPVRDSYFGMCDTGMIGQLEAANGFINKAQYPNQANVSPAEWGSIGNVRFFLSSRGSITVAASLLGADIYNCFVSAQDAYAKIEQNGVSAKFIYHGPGHGDDPAELRQTCAWRMAQVPRITNDAWIISLRATLG